MELRVGNLPPVVIAGGFFMRGWVVCRKKTQGTGEILAVTADRIR